MRHDRRSANRRSADLQSAAGWAPSLLRPASPRSGRGKAGPELSAGHVRAALLTPGLPWWQAAGTGRRSSRNGCHDTADVWPILTWHGRSATAISMAWNANSPRSEPGKHPAVECRAPAGGGRVALSSFLSFPATSLRPQARSSAARERKERKESQREGGEASDQGGVRPLGADVLLDL